MRSGGGGGYRYDPRPTVCAPFRPSDLVPATPPTLFVVLNLKFYRLYSYAMKLCMWFRVFLRYEAVRVVSDFFSAIFDKVTALPDSGFIPEIPCTSFAGLT